MPPKAEYWKYFNVVGVVAYCLIAECKQPNVSLGALPKPGEKKRICEYWVNMMYNNIKLVLLYCCFRCWCPHQSSLQTPQRCLGNICAQEGCQEDCGGGCQEVGAVQLWDGECRTTFHRYAFQWWSTDFSESGKSASIVVVDLIIAPSFFPTSLSHLPTGVMMIQDH